MTPSDERKFERLPKWAQQEIRRLEADLKYYKEKMMAGPESNTFADPYSGAPRPLGTDPTILFVLGEDRREELRCRIDTDHKGRAWLEVNGGDSLIVQPQAGNAVRLRPERL